MTTHIKSSLTFALIIIGLVAIISYLSLQALSSGQQATAAEGYEATEQVKD